MNTEDLEQPVEQPVEQAIEKPVEAPAERTVPLAALEDERRKRQQLEESLNETRSKMTELEYIKEEIKAWREAQKDIGEPDYWDQPKNYIDHQVQKANKSYDEIRNQNSQLSQQINEFNKLNEIRSTIESQTQHYRKQYEDYDQAIDYVRNIQSANMKLGGVPEDQIPQALAANEINLAATLAQNKIAYPEYVYKMAQNMGYKGKSPDEQKLENVSKGQQRASGGQSGKLGEYKRMPNDEFEAALEEQFGWLKR